MLMFIFFFFQAEDGIRDLTVTGVQTCALPICIRQDEYNVFGSATTYRVTGGYLHQETGTKIRGSYGTGFRAPSINELFFPNFGNPNLQPEKSQGLDVAVDQTLFKERVTLSAGYFWTRYRNLILSVFDLTACPAPFFFCAQN